MKTNLKKQMPPPQRKGRWQWSTEQTAAAVGHALAKNATKISRAKKAKN